MSKILAIWGINLMRRWNLKNIFKLSLKFDLNSFFFCLDMWKLHLLLVRNYQLATLCSSLTTLPPLCRSVTPVGLQHTHTHTQTHLSCCSSRKRVINNLLARLHLTAVSHSKQTSSITSHTRGARGRGWGRRRQSCNRLGRCCCPLWQVKIDAVELRWVRKFYAIGDNKLHATQRREGCERGVQGAPLWACPCLGKSLKLRLWDAVHNTPLSLALSLALKRSLKRSRPRSPN